LSFRLDDLNSVGEFYTENYFRQLVVAIETTPVFLKTLAVLCTQQRRVLGHTGELGTALRKLGFTRQRQWHPGRGFRALWYPTQ
jgi:hypothetical protein